jgi:hypothetical protein
MLLKIKHLLPLPIILQSNLRNNKLIPLALRLANIMPLRIRNTATSNKIVLSIFQAYFCGVIYGGVGAFAISCSLCMPNGNVNPQLLCPLKMKLDVKRIGQVIIVLGKQI